MKKIVFFLLIIAIAIPCYSATVTIKPGGTKTIQQAIDAAAPGDTIKLDSGEYTGEGNFNISFKGKRLTVRCADYGEIAKTIIKCSEGQYAFIFEEDETSKSVLDGVTIQGAEPNQSEGKPAAINIFGASPTIKNCVITENFNGIYVKGTDPNDNSKCKPQILYCTIKNMAAKSKHAVWLEDCSVSLTDCDIIGNRSAQNGAGIFMSKSIVTLDGCTLNANACTGKTSKGGGIYIDCNDLIGTKKVLNDHGTPDPNDDSNDIVPVYCNSSLIASNCQFYENSASSGACIYSLIGDIGLESCLMYNNESGCVEISNQKDYGDTMIFGCNFSYNISGKEVIYSDSNSTNFMAMYSQIYKNSGGGIYTDSNNVSISGCDIYNNSTFSKGSINIESDSNEAFVSISDCLIQNNTGLNRAAIHTNAGSISITNCEIDFNRSMTEGGGVYISNDNNSINGEVDISGCNIYSNTGGNEGAGIYCEVNDVTITDSYIYYQDVSGLIVKEQTKKGKLVVINSEILGNDGDYGGINVEVNEVRIEESLVYNNSGGSVTIDANSNKGKLLVSSSYIGSNKDGDGISCDINDVTIIDSSVVSNEEGGINISTESKEGRLVIKGGSVSYNINGDGIYAEVNDVNIVNCYISTNMSGGGIYVTTEKSGQIIVKNCQIYSNLDKDGIYAEVENAEISGCEIFKNGGGINLSTNFEEGEVNITDCKIEENKWTGSCGIYSNAKNFKLSDCVISDHDGGGITLISSNSNAKAEIVDCLITKNESPDGAAIYLEHDPYEDTNAKIRNCTIVGNKTDDGGSSVWVQSGNSIINSCIIRDNQTNQLIFEGNGTVVYSDIAGGWEGTGNIDEDPFFVMAGMWDSNNIWVEGNYHPLLGSPCINTGDPALEEDKKDVDLDGDPRVKWGRVDMGSDESINRILPVKADGTVKYATIQDAVNDANDWDMIRLSPGTYTNHIDSKGREILGNRNVDFLGKDLILESINPDDPAIVAATIIDCNASIDEPNSAFYLTKGEKHPARIEGITIKNGYGRFNLYNFKYYSLGGGIYLDKSSVILRNCNIVENKAEFGGGVFGNNGPIEDCNISNNFAMMEGGGLYLCSNDIRRSKIMSNTANRGGGMSYCDGDISDCYILKNKVIANALEIEGYGGGIYACDGQIARCKIAENQATVGGGLSVCGGTIMNCQVSDNNNVGIYGCDGLIINSIVSDNKTNMYGGGLFDCGGSIIGCTIANNHADQIGGGIAACHGKISNSILWSNSAPEENETADCNMPSYSCIQGSSGGIGNISVDPMFIDPAGRNYHLQIGSPCIDTGDAAFDEGQYVDIDGQQRVFGTRVDMGADEIVLSPADMNKDNKVDTADYVIFAKSWKAHKGTTNWNPICDLTGDGVVDEEDLSFMSGDWLWNWWLY